VHMFRTPVFWIGCLVAPALAMAMDICKAYLLLEFFPDKRDIILKGQALKGHSSSVRPAGHHQSAETPTPVEVQHTRTEASCSSLRTPQTGGSSSASVTGSRVLEGATPSAFVFDHPEGRPRPVQSLRAAHPSAGNTALADGLPAGPSRSLTSHLSSGLSGGSLRGGGGGGLPTGARSASEERDVETGGVGGFGEATSFGQHFATQTLPSLQVALTWRTAVAVVAAVGSLFVLLGVLLLTTAGSLQKAELEYDGSGSLQALGLETNNITACSVSKSCDFHATLTKDMKAPISVRYVVDPFFQTYPHYLESYNFKELSGRIPGEMARTHCTPTSPGTEDDLFPCGLIARSLFNDTYEVWAADDRPLTLDRTGIAWPSDLRRFANPAGYPYAAPWEWLYQRFPQVVSEAAGVSTEAFAVWMRPAMTPHVEDLYGFLHEDLTAGQQITIRVNASFPVGLDEGSFTKRLVLTGASSSASDSLGLGRLLFVAGLLCWSAALAMLVLRAFLRGFS